MTKTFEHEIRIELSRLETAGNETTRLTTNCHAGSRTLSPPKAAGTYDRFSPNQQLEVQFKFNKYKQISEKLAIAWLMVNELSGSIDNLKNELYHLETYPENSDFRQGAEKYELRTRVRILFIEHVLLDWVEKQQEDTALKDSTKNCLSKAKEQVSLSHAFFNPPPLPKNAILQAVSNCTIS